MTRSRKIVDSFRANPQLNTASLIFSLLRSNRLSPRSLPCGGDVRRAWPRSSPVPLAILGWSNAGSPRFLENPSHTFAPLSDPGRSAQVSPSRPAQCSPRFNNSKDTRNEVISGLNHTASVSAAYASSRALPHTHARLASGWWLAFTGRESNPLDSTEKFPSSTSDFLLSQAYPDAMLKNSLIATGGKFLPL
jgi:hypothetical protein